MRKGLKLTLMTVAIAMVSVQARAMAPTIQDIPSPIVGSAETVTGGGTTGNFVYLDAIDLNTMATDDVTSPSALLWTYTGTGANGASKYLINGVNPINVGVGGVDPTSPTTAQIINRNDLDPVPGKDSAKNTITIRNKDLSPLPLGSAGTVPGANDGNNVVPAQTQAVTFFCSDGNAYSSATVFFYTDNGGNDRLSGGDPFKVEKSDKIPAVWAKNTGEWFTAQTAPTQWNGSGVCLVAPLSGTAYASVITSMKYFSIAANQVYRFKMKMVCSQLTGGNMPFWDIVLENFDSANPTAGLNLYIMDTLVYANEKYANALTSAGSTFTWYWTPPAVTTPQWNDTSSGAFTPSNDAVNDPRLRFRIMDVDGTGQGETKSGSVCIQEVEIASASILRATTVGSPLVNITSLADHNASGTGNVEYLPVAAGFSTATFSGGALTLTPSTAAQTLELATIRPATDLTYSVSATDPTAQDNYPIIWKSGKILRMQVDVSAPTAADAASPYDAIVLLFNTMTDEVNTESYQTANKGIGSPKVGTAQTYTMFFYTGTETQSNSAGWHRLRWMVRAVNSDQANFPNGQLTNTGSVKISRIKVDEVIFK